MTKICVATVVYPEAEEFFDDFFSGLTIGNAVLAISEQGTTSIRDHLNSFKHHLFEIDETLSIPAVRAALFQNLKNHVTADFYIFIDIDDRLKADALQSHINALQNADFSYGDQTLYDGDFKRPMGKSLFEMMNTPERLETAHDLTHGNCVGLSALGLSRKALETLPETLPDTLIATDWYIAVKMLEAGLTGQKTKAVTDYRLQGRAYRALHPAQTREDWDERIASALVHFQALGYTERIEMVKHLQTFDLDTINQLAKEVCPQKPMWHEDVTRLAQYVHENKG